LFLLFFYERTKAVFGWHVFCIHFAAFHSFTGLTKRIQRKGTMTRHQLQQTVFRVEPLKNIVGVGDITAYQIVLNPGAALGTLGVISVPAYADIANDTEFDAQLPATSAFKRLASWIRQPLATLKS
jgi:hypothetical protein